MNESELTSEVGFVNDFDENIHAVPAVLNSMRITRIGTNIPITLTVRQVIEDEYEPIDDEEFTRFDKDVKESLEASGKFIPQVDVLDYRYYNTHVHVEKNDTYALNPSENNERKRVLREQRSTMLYELPNVAKVMKGKLRLGRVAEAKGLPENVERHLKGFVDPDYPMGKRGYTYANLKKKRPEAVALMGKRSRKQRNVRKQTRKTKNRKTKTRQQTRRRK